MPINATHWFVLTLLVVAFLLQPAPVLASWSAGSELSRCPTSASGLRLCYQPAPGSQYADAIGAAGRTEAVLHPALAPIPDEPDRPGIRQDTYYFLGYQFAIIGILFVLPESITEWSDEQKEDTSISSWWDNVRSPAWDRDKHYINYVLHPYWGATYYVRAKRRGFGDWEAFWYSVLLSTLFEFGAEAIFERPSVQDMFITPVVGTGVGFYFLRWHEQTQERVERRGEVRLRDRAVFLATDPLGWANRVTQRVLGRNTSTDLQPIIGYFGPSQQRHQGADGHFHGQPEAAPYRGYGLRLQVRW